MQTEHVYSHKNFANANSFHIPKQRICIYALFYPPLPRSLQHCWRAEPWWLEAKACIHQQIMSSLNTHRLGWLDAHTAHQLITYTVDRRYSHNICWARNKVLLNCIRWVVEAKGPSHMEHRNVEMVLHWQPIWLEKEFSGESNTLYHLQISFVSIGSKVLSRDMHIFLLVQQCTVAMLAA